MIHDLEYLDPRLLWLNNLYLMWIAFLPFPTGLLGNHPGQPVAVALYGTVCAITCLSFSAMRWYASFRGRLMKKEIGETKLRRDLRLSLCFALLYVACMAAGLFFPSLGVFLYAAIPASYTISRLAGTKAVSRRPDRRPAGSKNIRFTCPIASAQAAGRIPGLTYLHPAVPARAVSSACKAQWTAS